MKEELKKEYSKEFETFVKQLKVKNETVGKMLILDKLAELQVRAIKKFLVDNNLFNEELDKKLEG
jgi:hypothetical protein